MIYYGGSFNPPTKAHMKIIETLINFLEPEGIIISPVSKKNYPKSDLLEDSLRNDMVEIVVSELMRTTAKGTKTDIYISLKEQKNNSFIGTIKELKAARAVFKTDVALAMGYDNLLGIETWIEAETLLKEFPIIVFNRNHEYDQDYIKMLEDKYGAKISFIEFDYPISSSLIRKDVEKHKKHLPKKVYEYIKDNGLYRGEEK